MLEIFNFGRQTMFEASSTLVKTTPGNYQFSVSAPTTMNVVLIGAGGGGASSDDAYGSPLQGAGGNGGNYLIINRISVSSGIHSLTVGSGGIGGRAISQTPQTRYGEAGDSGGATSMSFVGSGGARSIICWGGNGGAKRTSSVYVPSYPQSANSINAPGSITVVSRLGGQAGGGMGSHPTTAGGGGAATRESDGGRGYGSRDGQPYGWPLTGNGGGDGNYGGGAQLWPGVFGSFGRGAPAGRGTGSGGTGFAGAAIITFGVEYEFT